MRRLTLGFVLAASLVTAAPLFALRTDGSLVIIPVIGRFPGAGGTQWQTDVFLSNPYEPEQVVTLKFYPGGGARVEATVTLGKYSTATLTDIVLDTFGMANAGGVLEVFALRILARATIYNTGNAAGQFGQGVPGIPKEFLSRQAFLHGMSGTGGSRVNIGAANPNDVPVLVNFYIADASGGGVHQLTATVAAHGYVQFNDIFNTYGIAPQAGLQIDISSAELPIYGYSSEVRNDTGDAIFNFGTNPNA
ncbi:MAG: hypothetical protein ACXW2P_11685 [Thermoanaerobaculia bacterium]